MSQFCFSHIHIYLFSNIQIFIRCMGSSREDKVSDLLDGNHRGESLIIVEIV